MASSKPCFMMKLEGSPSGRHSFDIRSVLDVPVVTEALRRKHGAKAQGGNGDGGSDLQLSSAHDVCVSAQYEAIHNLVMTNMAGWKMAIYTGFIH